MENKVTRERALVADLMLGTTFALPRDIIVDVHCLERVWWTNILSHAKCVECGRCPVQFDSLSDVAKVLLFRKLIKLINSNGRLESSSVKKKQQRETN